MEYLLSTENDGATIERRRWNAVAGKYETQQTILTNNSVIATFLDCNKGKGSVHGFYEYVLTDNNGRENKIYSVNCCLDDVIRKYHDDQLRDKMMREGR